MKSDPEYCQIFSSSPLLQAMFRARKQVFVDRLGWDVPVLAGEFEVDQFDVATATYLVVTDTAGRHQASARLLPTEGPHILGDLFSGLCSERVPKGPGTLEITRFCIEPSISRLRHREVRNQLISALVRHALANGVSTYTAVANMAWFRQVSRFGWQCRALGKPRWLHGEELVALQIDIGPATPAALLPRGIYRDAAHEIAMTAQVVA